MSVEDDAADIPDVRVISVYATRWRWQSEVDDVGFEHLVLGRLEEFYNLFREQLPKVLAHVKHDPNSVTFPPLEGEPVASTKMAGLPVTKAELWLFALPSDQLVAALDLEFQSPPLDVDTSRTINVLEHGAYGQISIDGKLIEGHISDLARKAKAMVPKEEVDTSILPPERHQIVFAAGIGELADGEKTREEKEKRIEATIGLILYRSDPPYRPQFMPLYRPTGLNTENAIGAVTPYVSLLSGHPDYVENSVFLTVVQAVGTSARFRQIWHRAHRRVREFRRNQAEDVGKQTKKAMEILADELGNLELDLSFSVEASADLGLLIPLLRIESFHKDLYAAMELRERAETVSRMFTRLDATIRSELTAIEIRDQRAEEQRRFRRNAAVSVLSFIAVPLGFLLAFFGINAQQVDQHLSIFDWGHYLTVYIAAAALALTPLIAFLVIVGRAWMKGRKDKLEELQSTS
jgi:hypothetical protein